MKGITGGVLGPTGPIPVLPSGGSGIKLVHAYHGMWLKATTGIAYVGGSTGGASAGVGFPIAATGAGAGDTLFLPFPNPREVYVLVTAGSQVRWLIA